MVFSFKHTGWHTYAHSDLHKFMPLHVYTLHDETPEAVSKNPVTALAEIRLLVPRDITTLVLAKTRNGLPTPKDAGTHLLRSALYAPWMVFSRMNASANSRAIRCILLGYIANSH